MHRLILSLCCGLAWAAFFAAISSAQAPSERASSGAGSTENISRQRSGAISAEGSPGIGDNPVTSKAKKPKADQKKAGNSKAKTATTKAANATNAKVLPGITPEREAAVMTFVQRHHPALTELLIHLKENAPKEYDRAVRDLLRTSERLASIQERDSLAYELELQSWQARSRAQLLAARLQMGESDELRQQLRAALNEEYDLRLQLLQRDKEKAADRLKHLGEQIDRVSQRREEEIERQLKQLTSAARGGEAKGKSPAKRKASTNQ